MANEQLVSFIKTQRDKGVSATDIEKALIDAGWPAVDVQEGMAAGGIGMSSSPMSSHREPEPLAQEQSMPLTEPTAVKPMATQPMQGEPMKSESQPMKKPMSTGEPEDMFAATPSLDMPMGATPEKSGALSSMASSIKGKIDSSLSNMQVGASSLGPSLGASTISSPTQQKKAGGVEYQEGMSGKKKLMVFGGMILVAALLVTGGVYAYFQYYQSPTRIASLIMNSVSSTTSVSFQGHSEGTVVTAGKSVKNSTDFNGTTTLFTAEPIQAEVDITTTTANQPASSGKTKMRLVNGGVYMQLLDLGSEGASMAGLLNKWIVVAPEESVEDSPLFAVLPTTGSMSAQDRSTLHAAFVSSNLFTVGEKKGTEQLQGKEVVSYSYSINKDNVKQFLSTVKPIFLSNGIEEDDYTALLSQVDQWGVITGMVWVGKADYRIYKLTAKGDKEYSLSIEFSNYNQPLSVQKPADAATLDELVTELLGGAGLGDGTAAGTTPAGDGSTATDTPLDTPVVPTPDTPTTSDGTKKKKAPDADSDGLSDADELAYGTNANNPDTDGDTYTDGEEVKNGFNPLGAGVLGEPK